MKNSKNSLTSHLLELRSRLLIVISSILVCTLILSPFANYLYNLLALPLTDILPKGSSMIAVDVASPFLAPFKLILLLSVVITFPISIYNFWAFVSPGLYKNEKKALQNLVNKLQQIDQSLSPEEIQTHVYTVGKENGYDKNLRDFNIFCYSIAIKSPRLYSIIMIN